MRLPARSIAFARPARYFSGWNCAWFGNRRHGPVSNADRRAADLGHVVQTRAMRGGQLAIEERFVVLGSAEQVAVEPLEVTRDPLAGHDALDAIDGRRVALGREPRAALAVEALEIEIAIVERIDEMGGRRAGLAAADARRRRARPPTSQLG